MVALGAAVLGATSAQATGTSAQATGTRAHAGANTLLHLTGLGPLRLGMTATAARQTGWLADRRIGCKLGGLPYPVGYSVTGRKAPPGIRGIIEFNRGRLTGMSFTRGVITTVGVTVGKTTTARMAARYRLAGYAVSSAFDTTFQGTFVNVSSHGHQRIGAFGEGATVTLLAIPRVPLCE